ncbi:MAG: small subunit ribosomal protein S20 [Alphaproteobacteria bacterium]|jgi:small subunit ribosomal protein S20
MADHKQALKRIRQTAKVTELNKTTRTRMRTTVKALETAIEAGDKDAIGKAFPAAMSNLHKCASKGILKKETASRKVSRLSARVKGLTA